MKRTRRTLMPPRSMIRPARIKNGTASRMKLPVPLTMLCGSTTIDAVPVIHMYAAVASSSTKPTGTPAKIATKKNTKAAVIAASPANHDCHVSRVTIATAMSSANAPATFQDIRKRHADVPGPRGAKIEDHAHERVIAAAIRDCAANEGERRQRQSRDFV